MGEGPGSGRKVERASLRDVARHAGVSPAAVSKVIRNAYGVSPAMRQRVESSIEELGYRPRIAARAMRGSTFTIGFEVPHMGNDFFTLVVEGATTHLTGSGYQMIVAPGLGYLSGKVVLESLVDRQVDGIIAISSDVSLEWMDNLAKSVPLVLLGRHAESSHFDTITGDDTAGAEQVMDHLLGQGHTRIAHLTISPPSDSAPHAYRRSVYLDRMKKAGLEPQVMYTHIHEQEAHDDALTLLTASPRPTAIFAGHDNLAIAVMRAVDDLGIPPSEIAVVGYDNVEIARHPFVSLSSVDQDGRAMGAQAIEFLMERIRDGRTTPKRHQFAPQLQVRRSSQRPVKSPPG